MFPALLLIPLVALFRIFVAWQPSGRGSWTTGFSPVAAVALCAGVFLPRRLALVIPLGILLISDLIIDAHYGANFFAVSLLARYALLAVIGIGGCLLRRSPRGDSVAAVLSATLAGSVFFYVASNTLTWLGSPDYPQRAAGLFQALTTGLPGYLPSYVFFRNELVSDVLYSIVFLACVRLAQPTRMRQLSPRTASTGRTGFLRREPPGPLVFPSGTQRSGRAGEGLVLCSPQKISHVAPLTGFPSAWPKTNPLCTRVL